MKYIWMSFLMLVTSGIIAQEEEEVKEHQRADNLVPNPSFEDIKKVPTRWMQSARSFNRAMSDWSMPTETHADIYTARAEADVWTHPQKHSNNRQTPRTGDNMVGIKTYGTGNTPTFWHEYLQVKLKKNLTVGSNYYVEFWVMQDENNVAVSNNIGVAFRTVETSTGDRLPLYFPVKFKTENIIEKGNKWVKVSGVIAADSAYSHLIIGNFCGDEDTKHKRVNPDKGGGAYYLVDDVTVRPADKGMKVTPVPTQCPQPKPLVVVEETSTEVNDLPTIKYQTGQTIELSNVFFETNKATLLDASKEELDKLADIMYDYPNMVIEIRGHTDNVGSDADNLTLSEARAQAVMEYLIKKKTKKSRITAKGYGETKPVAENDTEEGRAKNRRVEFVIVER